MPIVGQFGSLAGLGSLILPGGAMESIATVTVGSGGAANVEFTSIPSGFQHLQIRGIGRDLRAITAESSPNVSFNGSSSGYAEHALYGAGTSAAAYGATGLAYFGFIGSFPGNANSAGIFGALVIDILDYNSTSKTKTVRSFNADDRNGGGYVVLQSGLWNNTAAISSIRIADSTGSGLAQHSTFALYGIKAP